jgi:hypothetical protein
MNRRAMYIVTLLAISTCALSRPASADTITQTFSLTIEPAANLVQGVNVFPTTPIALFNPLTGTLNSFAATLTGPAIWTSQDAAPNMFLGLNVPVTGFTYSGGDSVTTGPLNVGLGGSGFSTKPDFVSSFIGTGMASFGLLVDVADPVTEGFTGTFVGDSFSANLTGSVTYDFTPAATTPVPEPSSLLLVGTGLFGLMGMGLRKKRLV